MYVLAHCVYDVHYLMKTVKEQSKGCVLNSLVKVRNDSNTILFRLFQFADLHGVPLNYDLLS